ncbi:MAG: FtsX-like permease family protein [Chloroflexota bacterium]|nr:FtsX-like permease family protein [Chloroflexota bacterium]
MKKIYLKLWRDIRKQKWQFIALVLIILLGVTSYSAMIGMIDDVENSLDRTLDELRFQDFILRFDDPIPQELTQEVAALTNVDAVTGRLVMDTGLYLSEDNQAHARLVGMPTDEQPAVNQLYIQEGRYLQPGDDMAAVLDHHLAEYYGYGPGTVLHPIINGEQVDVEVVGVGINPEYLMAVASQENILPSPGGFTVLFMPQETVERLFDAQGSINELNIILQDASPQAVDQAVEQVKILADGASVRSVVKRADNPSYSLLMLDLEGGREMMGMVPTMFLVIAAMSIYVSLNRMVQAQRPEIGMIKALGYSRWAVMRYYLIYAAIIALVGSLLGFALSYPLGRAFAQVYAAEFGLPFVITQFHLGAAAEAIAITLLVALLAAFFPARASARIPPAQAMRFDPSVALVKGSIPWLEKVLRRIFPLSTGSKIALRNLFRNRRRTVTTALGFVFAFVVLLACWSLFDGMNHMLEVQFQQTDRWDLQVMFSNPQSYDLLDQVRDWQGVEAAEAILAMPVTVQAGMDEKNAFLVALSPDTKLHGFKLPAGQTTEGVLRPNMALLGAKMGEKLSLQTGDTVTLQTPLGTQQVTVNADNYEVMNAGVYVNLSWVQSQIPGGQELFNGLWLLVDEGQRSEVKKKLYALPGVANVDLKQEIATGWQELMGLYYVMMGMFLIFALVIAGAVIFNTMTVNVLERQREIATMRALGQSRGHIRRMITVENLLIGLLAIIPGFALGVAATYYLFQLFSASADFYLPFYIAPASYVIVTLLIFGTALISQLPAMRHVNRMDLAEATKVMT